MARDFAAFRLATHQEVRPRVEVRLVVKKGRTTTSQLSLRRFPAVIGRHRECNLRIAARQVSRRHCVLKCRDGWLIVCDLESCNGTVVNGRSVRGERVLQPGDVLEVGPISFEVVYTPPPVAMTPLEAADTLLNCPPTSVDEYIPDPSDNAYELSERLCEIERARAMDIGDTHHPSSDAPSSDSGSKIVLLDDEASNLSPTKRLFSDHVAEGDTAHRRM